MTAALQVNLPRGEDDLTALGAILSTSFGFPPEEAPEWLARLGSENLRVVHEGGALLGGLALIEMGQFFGGRSVPMTGVAGVAVAPQARGRGIATQLMATMLEQERSAGTPLSALYPASLSLYRSVGYGEAGSKWEVSLRLREVGLKERGLPIARITTLDDVGHLYRQRAQRVPGHLDRGPYLTHRIWNRRRAGPSEGYRFGPEDAPEGYLVLTRRPSTSAVFELVLTDFVVATRQAAERAFAFLASHATMADTAVWNGSPDDPALSVLPERCWQVRLVDPWMLRLVDLPAALEQRGWPEGASGVVDLDVRDETLPDNAGRWRLEVANGRARVTRGGDGKVVVDARALASVYAGFQAPSALATAGLLSGPPASLAAAATLFAGPAPWMPDHF